MSQRKKDLVITTMILTTSMLLSACSGCGGKKPMEIAEETIPVETMVEETIPETVVETIVEEAIEEIETAVEEEETTVEETTEEVAETEEESTEEVEAEESGVSEETPTEEVVEVPAEPASDEIILDQSSAQQEPSPNNSNGVNEDLRQKLRQAAGVGTVTVIEHSGTVGDGHGDLGGRNIVLH